VSRILGALSFGALVALVVGAALVGGAHRGWSLAVAELLALGSLVLWLLGGVLDRRLEWRATAPDWPLGLLLLVVLAQLAIGPGPVASWALGPAAAPAGEPLPLPGGWRVGTVSPWQTLRSLLLFGAYVAVYVGVVQVTDTRRRLDGLVRALLVSGGALGFLGILDYLYGGAWLARVRDRPFAGRLSATFVNPDHFAVWLNMLVCLGLGHLLSRASRGSGARVMRHLLTSRSVREDALRRYLPLVGLAVMATALLLTLSRGGVVALLAGLATMLLLAGALGWTRWSLVVVGALLAAALGLGAWVGLGPLLTRFQLDPYWHRWVQAVSSLEVLGAFPALGVGLGAYRDVYGAYQPAELSPGRVVYPYAHNDWLQLLVELGAVGGALVVWAVWRTARDLVGGHLLGRGRCPVGAGEDDGARRSDPLSLGLGLGGVGAVVSLAAHSLFDFGARIPANGFLGAACLGIATVALHTRFSPRGARLLSRERSVALGGGRAGPALLGAAVVVGAGLLVPLLVGPPLAAHALRSASGPGGLARADEIVRRWPGDPDALAGRSRLRLAAAERVWAAGLAPDGRLLATWDERRAAARTLLSGAVEDLRRAILVMPTDPLLFERLAWVHVAEGAVAPAEMTERRDRALAVMGRALALAPRNPYVWRSLAVLAAQEPAPRVDVALAAGRRAVELDPGVLPDLVVRLLPLALPGARWLAVVPERGLERLALGSALSRLGLHREAADVYRAAAATGAAGLEPVARWLAGRARLRAGEPRAAIEEAEAALARAGDEPEAHRLLGEALEAAGDARALDAYRRALTLASARPPGPAEPVAFGVDEPRVRELLRAELGPAAEAGAVRHRRVLGRYLLERRLWGPARRIWEEVVEERPRDAEAHAALGRCLAGLGARGEALEAYRRAVALDGRVASYRLRLAELLWDTEQFHQAINEWRAVVTREPGHLEARLRLAAAYLAIGERVAAVQEYRRVLEIAPDDPVARRALGMGGRSGP